MNVSDVIFERPVDPPDPAYVLRVRILGTEQSRAGAQLVAQVGTLPVLDLISLFGQEGVTGFLADEPPVGAEVAVGYLGKELVPSGHTYDPPVA